MTEADKGFIVDDDEEVEEEEDGSDDDEAERRRRKEQKRAERKRRREEEEADLDDEDLLLINENYGRPTKKKGGRLVRKGGSQEDSQPTKRTSSSLDNIFDMEDDEPAVSTSTSKQSRPFDERELDSDGSDIEDFVVDDEDEREGEEETEFQRKQRIAKAKEQRRLEKTTFKNIARDVGISDEVWRDIQDLFGDGSDYDYALYVQEGQGKKKSKYDDDYDEPIREEKKAVKLTDIYEPSEIASRHLTEEDEVIRLKDVPERFQLLPESPPLSEEDQARAVAHIDALLLQTAPENSPLDLASPASRTQVISRALKFFSEDHFEVPFLIAHRKDHLVLEDYDRNPLGPLERHELWKIWDLNVQFLALEARRRTVRNLITELRTSPELLDSTNVQQGLLHDTYIDDMLRTAQSMEDIMDVSVYLQLYYSDEIRKVEEAKGRRKELKRAVRKTEYEDARKVGMKEFVKLYGVDVKKFSESISSMRNLHVPEDIAEDPLDAAKIFVIPKSLYSTEQRVVEAGRMMLAHQIAVDPTFRRFIRKVYETDGVVTVTPTERGQTEITQMHPYYKFKYLKEKPVYKFDKTEYLSIHKAEVEGLITVRVYVDEEAKLLEDVVKNITNDFSSEMAERWNDERRRCAERATKEMVFPAVVKWFKEMMAAKATEVLVEECRAALERKIDVQPYRRDKSQSDDYYDNDDENKTHARVMAISWGDGDPQSAAYAVCLDESGRVASTTKLSQLHMRDHKQKDHDMILSRLREHQIEVIVVGGSSISTKTRLMPDLAETIKRINDDTSESYERDRKRYRREFVMPGLEIVEDDIARLAMNSKRYQKEFPDFPPLAKYCVSLARRIQDTTYEFSTLCNADDEIRLIRVHPLQNLLPEDKLKSAFERAFINVVNYSGVDVNDAASLPHRSNTMQFVSGLGPRKAGFILNRITKLGGKLENRSDLIQKKMLGRVIFMNSASFIQIHKKHFKRTNALLDVLDYTRIHPEDYDIARKMAAGALDIDEVVGEDDPSSHVAELMDDHPERLNNLLLDDFADELYRTQQELKRITLSDIKDEIIQPYAERRRRFNSASIGDFFFMLTGETEETLVGFVTSAQVVKTFDRFIKCRLTSNGLDGNLQLALTPAQRTLREGDAFQAVVTKVDTSEFRVELDAREELVDSGKWMQDYANRIRDKYFSLDREEEDKQKKASSAPKIAAANKVKRAGRSVNHPFWKNVNHQEAVNELTGPSVRNGSLIIRPSTKGNNHICITWKVDEGVFQHIDILETNKENEWALGKTLIIDGKKFDELEEIIATYIEPMAMYFSDAKKHIKYRSDTLEEALRWVEREVELKKRSMYAIIPCPTKSQCMYLVFQHIGKSPRHEYITITPDGFKFGDSIFKRLDQMFDAFKKREAERMKKAEMEASKRRRQLAEEKRSSSNAGGGYGQSSGGYAPSRAGPSGAMPPRPSAPAPMMNGGRSMQLPSRPIATPYGQPNAVPNVTPYGQPQPGWSGGNTPGMRPGAPQQYPSQQYPSQQYPPQQQQQYGQYQQQQQMPYRPQAPPPGPYYGSR
ncbi:hypothetical protein BCR33DRAFT_698681 [Rhizoclosmatium globosum]|uniref:Transcription elongation factor Spt6 n=1 Tax=Rhizoclosmatium globosum TaxID=329046 RepID=A0A1Y2C5D3_9FUNG|nr:hypothetical protein BCR33DRAFT_698681 [Rhizoclosmatium globosum]|eukprot:ORY42146.1 hypothetical protein BCR33DRAFT_698681 [Rhizoclosmatium globosum]